MHAGTAALPQRQGAVGAERENPRDTAAAAAAACAAACAATADRLRGNGRQRADGRDARRGAGRGSGFVDDEGPACRWRRGGRCPKRVHVQELTLRLGHAEQQWQLADASPAVLRREEAGLGGGCCRARRASWPTITVMMRLLLFLIFETRSIQTTLLT